MSSVDLATTSLLDADQGVCPSGHRCEIDRQPGYRACDTCAYRGWALTCWDITPTEIDAAERAGANAGTVACARSCLSERG